MFARTLIAAAAVCTLASSALARPIYQQLPASNIGISSQDRGLSLLGLSTRAADDFFMSSVIPSDHFVTSIQVVMIGNVAPDPSKLGVTIRHSGVSNGFNAPGALVRTLVGARAVAFAGPTGVPGFNKYLVSFSATGAETIILRNNIRYWIAPFARSSQSGTWSFAKKIGPVRNAPSMRQVGPISSWLPFAPGTDCAFTITTIQ